MTDVVSVEPRPYGLDANPAMAADVAVAAASTVVLHSPRPPTDSPPADVVAEAAAAKPPKTSRPKPVRLLPSLFAHRKPTIYFEYPPFLGIKRDADFKDLECLDPASREVPRFKISATVHEYNCVRNAFLRAGFIRDDESDEWVGMWSKHLKEDQYARLNPFQKMNHFPGTWNLGRKDLLARNMARLRRDFGEHYNVSTPTYILPNDRAKLKHEMEDEPKSIWIMKPPSGSCGRGIHLISKAADSSLPPPNKAYVAQKYVKHPYLIDGRKFDLRIYVLVTSYDPLRVYLFHQGLVRFCTEKYSLSSKNLKNRYGHLTNYSVNKKSDLFEANEDAAEDGVGSKWSLQALLRWFQANGIDDNKVMANICDVVIKTLISCESEVSSMCNRFFRNRTAGMSASPCFEVLGFDILLDKHLKAWLLEVNVSPSLSSSSPMDKKIKNMLLTDTFHLVGFSPYDPKRLGREMERKKMDRLLGRSRGFAGTVHRNVRQLQNLTVGDLTLWELSVLCETEDEMSRCGHFTRIFPTMETRYYHQFFESQRFNNYLLDMWLHKWRPSIGIDGLYYAVKAKSRALRGGPAAALTPADSDRGRRGRSVSRPASSATRRSVSAARGKSTTRRRAASVGRRRPVATKRTLASAPSTDSGSVLGGSSSDSDVYADSDSDRYPRRTARRPTTDVRRGSDPFRDSDDDWDSRSYGRRPTSSKAQAWDGAAAGAGGDVDAPHKLLSGLSLGTSSRSRRGSSPFEGEWRTTAKPRKATTPSGTRRRPTADGSHRVRRAPRA